MTQWNSTYYRRKAFNSETKGAVESITGDISFMPIEPPVLDGLISEKIAGKVFRDEIRDFIAVSPAITYNLLNVAHSSFLKEGSNITGINGVIKLIGSDIVVSLLKDYIERSHNIRKSQGIHPYTDQNLYAAIKAANLALLLADETGYPSHYCAYIAALLHNLGAYVLTARFPVVYSRIITSGSIDFSGHVLSEENALGINHCFVGARMVEGWGAFPFLADAIFYHHHPLNKVRQANMLVKLVYLSSMVEGKDGGDRMRYLETGKELFGFSPNQIDEFISIADLKAQVRLMKLGIEPRFNKGEPVYQPDSAIEMRSTGDAGAHSLVAVMAERIQKTVNKNDRLRVIGQAIHTLSGLDEILYFRQNIDRKLLYGINLKVPDNTSLKNDLIISLDEKESIIVTSFLMGMEINSLDRVDNTAPGLFDLQVSNYMNVAGLYCVPLIRNGSCSGVLVAGVNSPGLFKGAEGHRIRGLIESILPCLTEDDVQNETGASGNKNSSDSIQTRKLIHEINNPLSAIKNFLKVLNMKLDDINVESNEIKIIDDELNRIAKLLKDFKSSSSPGETKEKSTSNIKNIVSDTIMLIKNSRVNGPEINITVQAEENIPEIMIDRDAFRQVLINLVNNAIEAMPGGGNITVAVQYKPESKSVDSRPSSIEAGRERIEISVSDDGPGIPDNLKAGVFKKQSTTKADHDGLGLLIVYELVKRMGGTITFDNNNERGARFNITMPVT